MEENDIYGEYSWQAIPAGYTAKIPCVYNEDKEAKRLCVASINKYGKTNFDDCQSKMAVEIGNLNDLADDLNTEDDQLQVSKQLQNITQTNAASFGSKDVKNTAEILEKIIDFDKVTILPESTKTNILKSFHDILETENYEEMAKDSAASSLRNSVEKFTDRISTDSEKNREFLKQPTIAIMVFKATDDRVFFKVSGQNDQLDDSNLSQDESDDSAALFSARVPGYQDKSVTAVLFDNPSIYPDNSTVTSKDFTNTISSFISSFFSNLFKSITPVNKVASLIADVKYAELKGSHKIEDNKSVHMNFSLKDIQPSLQIIMALRPNYECVYYNTTKKSWTTGRESGCISTVVKNSVGKEQVTCSCDHMTSFAVLMSFDSDYDPAERIVTTLLLAASLVCLILTILAYLPLKDMLRRRSVRIHLLLAISFILSAIVFYSMEHGVNMNRKGNKLPSVTDTASNPCLFIAFLVNYLWLCQMAWMVCEAVMLYLDLVIVFNIHIKRFLLKSNLICWGIPLLFPTIGMIWGQEDFADPTTCFIRRNYGLISFYVPVILCILFNINIFIRIFMSLFWKCTAGKGKKDANSTTVKRTLRRRKQFKFAVTLTTILGLAWVLGFFLIIDGESTIWIRWLFIIFNSSQGIFIFILYVVLNDDLNKAWKKILKRSRISSSSSSSGAPVPLTRRTGLGRQKTDSTALSESASIGSGTLTKKEISTSSPKPKPASFDLSKIVSRTNSDAIFFIKY